MTEVLKRQCSKSKKSYNQVSGSLGILKLKRKLIARHSLSHTSSPPTLCPEAHLDIRGEGRQGAGEQRQGWDNVRRLSGSR